jgi:hypothetical protein
VLKREMRARALTVAESIRGDGARRAAQLLLEG